MKLTQGQLIGIALIVVSLGGIIYQATRSESSVTFYTPQEVYASPSQFENKLFRVSGLVERGSKVWDAQSRNLAFSITDMKGHGFLVHYKGIPPDLFKEGQGVVVEGRLASLQPGDSLQKRTLKADLLMVKHSEVYDTKTDHSAQREAKLLDSISQ